MRKTVLITSVALLAVLTSGCMQMHMNSTIAKDGSGTMDVTLSLSQVLSESMEDLKSLNVEQDMDQVGFLLEGDKDQLQERIKGHGVKIKKFEKSMVKGRETVQLALEFKDIEGMSYAMREISQDEGGGLAIIDNGDGTFTLKPHQYDWPAIAQEEEAEITTEMPQMDPAQMGKQMEVMGKLMSSLSELDISMKITVPGDIVSSNAPTVEGRTSIWTVNQANMMSGGGDMEPNIVFSAKGLKLKAIKE